ncbi:hypothetical protein GMOD_00006229 [Pyrenophora seminiperda CCB06]|uniref:Uncharacterized protein n=1 Tax=Pyrenophora seminiperda CCB06 TaxID=1302712 RepID=A0A3M7M4L4_9PLEO|nr:hypothetical protein GMOD_00006229 [Pyrenophora seminiperda CCB06]
MDILACLRLKLKRIKEIDKRQTKKFRQVYSPIHNQLLPSYIDAELVDVAASLSVLNERVSSSPPSIPNLSISSAISSYHLPWHLRSTSPTLPSCSQMNATWLTNSGRPVVTRPSVAVLAALTRSPELLALTRLKMCVLRRWKRTFMTGSESLPASACVSNLVMVEES